MIKRAVTVGLPLLSLGVAFVVPAVSRADRVTLKGGGEVRGVIIPDAKQPKSVLVQTDYSAKPLVFSKDQVLRIVREASPLDEYVVRKAQLAETAQAQFDLGVWCEAKKLTGPATVHFQRAIELEKNFAPAHRKLGHVEQNGQWFTSEQLRKAQGLILYKGRWITSQEKERLEVKVATGNEQSSWTRRIKLLRSAIMTGTDAQREQAETQLAAIKDVAAVTPLVQILGSDSDSVRLLLAQILGAIKGPEAAAALVGRVLAEADPSVRKATLDELARRKEPDTNAAFLRALSSKDPHVVGRAALALAALKVNSAVPKMINALVYTEKRMVMVPSQSGPSTPSYGFNSASPGPGHSGVFTYPMSTGPVVGPGVVAYGAIGVPMATNSAGLSTGGGGGGPQMTPQLMTFVYQNSDVLESLQSLTGVNFGFDIASWKQWTTTSFRPSSSVPPRQVPQP
jgi:hypothetical protein